MAGKLNLQVSALRWGEDIHATVQAAFPDACHRAEVTDIYPGGRIVYSADPGEAQIFVRITRTAEPSTAAAWEESHAIPHSRFHQDLAVIAEFEGRTFIARTRIHRFKPGQTTPAAAATPAEICRSAGLPPAAKVAMAPAPLSAAAPSAPLRYSNAPPRLSA